MMFGWGSGGSWVWMLVMGVVWLVVVAAIVFAVVVLIRRSANAPAGPRDAAAPSRAQAILEERFARGEIDADEFQQRSEALRR